MQGLFLEWMQNATKKICKPHDNPITLWNYCIYQVKIYSGLKQFNLDTLEELQISMENYQNQYQIHFPRENWANEYKEKWWIDHVTK
jgi:hypothetical protein